MRKLISNIVFSMNRPLQLYAYLESLELNFPRERMQTYVIYKESLFNEQYEEVFKRFSSIKVIYETNFHDDFHNLMKSLNTEYVLFGTDDVVYFNSVDLDCVRQVFQDYPDDILGFSMRMNPDDLSDPYQMVGILNETFYKVNWKTAKDKTASYPFELNSTIYRTDLIQHILDPVSRERLWLQKLLYESILASMIHVFTSLKSYRIYCYTYHDPNTLEGLCCRWFKQHKQRYPSYLFFQKLCSSAIQVNIVNTAIDNPIDGCREHSVEELNKKFIDGYRLDIRALRDRRPVTTHIGQNYFVLKKMD